MKNGKKVRIFEHKLSERYITRDIPIKNKPKRNK